MNINEYDGMIAPNIALPVTERENFYCLISLAFYPLPLFLAPLSTNKCEFGIIFLQNVMQLNCTALFGIQ